MSHRRFEDADDSFCRFRRNVSTLELFYKAAKAWLSVRAFAWVGAAVLATYLPNALAYDWLQFNGGAAHSGNNTSEALLGAANVNLLTLKYQIALPAVTEGAPAFLESVTTAGGVKDLLFITTRAGDTIALDASTGSTVWTKSYPNTFSLALCISGNPPCATTSSPAVDPNRLYVYSYGLDGNVHKFQVGDGTEILTGGWPELTTLKPFVDKASAALSIATSAGTTYLYVAQSGFFGDGGDFQGHVTAINLATGAQNVFNMMCSNQTVHFVNTPGSPDCAGIGAGIWSRPGVIYDAGTGPIFMATGNQFTAGANNWGETVVALKPDGTGSGGQPIDTYTPANHTTLDNTDTDLGSTDPAILPVPLSSNVQHLAVQGGKDGKLRLLNLANLSGAGGPGNLGGEIGSVLTVPGGNVVVTQPAVWVNPADGTTWVFVVNDSGSFGYRLAIDGSGNPSLAIQWQNAFSGASPLVANNVLYFASRTSALLRALDPTTGSLLFSSASISAVHWQSPVVANCALYINDSGATGHLNAFSLPNILTTQPTKLAITGVNGGASPTAGVGFNVVLQVQDCNHNPVNVTADTAVTMSLFTGSGSLGGTLSCTVTTGTNSCTVSGVTYSKGETGVVVLATRTSGNTLSPDTSAAFTVNAGLSSPPSKLAITSVNGGANPTVGSGFNVVVQAQDNTSTAQNVIASTAVTLSLNTGTGALGGTLTCTITAGSNSCTVSGVTYSKAESGVIVTATRTSGDVLAAGNSAPFTVNAVGSPAPIKLVITSVNSGANPTVGTGFNVVVQAQDGTSTAQNVIASTAIILSLNNGTGVLGGTLTCTITAGTNFCTVGGVTYSKAESGVIVTATRTSGDVLAAGNSAPFTVNAVGAGSGQGTPVPTPTLGNWTTLVLAALLALVAIGGLRYRVAKRPRG